MQVGEEMEDSSGSKGFSDKEGCNVKSALSGSLA